jgi:hypothetical protein
MTQFSPCRRRTRGERRQRAQRQQHQQPCYSATGAACDLLNNRAGMVGGFDGNLFHNETWQWTGTDWMQRHPKTVLWARGAPVVSNDDAHGTVVIFGGLGDVNPYNTWTWDGTNWTMQSPATQPPLVYYTPAAFDPDLGGVVMFGGVSRTNVTWGWTGSDWGLVRALTPPLLLNSQGTAYDKKTSQLMFGGPFRIF